jgi:RNA polymerase sigma-70 factor (ECF subfamily)
VELYSRAERADDAALLAGVAVGDDAATTAFVRRYQSRVFGLALSITRDRGLAEDVSQEAFLRAWRAASGYDARRGSALTWLLTITRNLAIDVVRARRLLPVDGEALERLVGETLEDDPRSPENAAGIELESARARARLREIPPAQARAVVLATILGCTAAEISRREDIPLGTAKTRLRAGLRALRSGLVEESP